MALKSTQIHKYNSIHFPTCALYDIHTCNKTKLLEWLKYKLIL